MVSSPLENVAAPLHHKLSVVLKLLLMPLSHALSQCAVTLSHALSQCAVTRTWNFLSSAHTQNSGDSRPANTGTHNPRLLTQRRTLMAIVIRSPRPVFEKCIVAYDSNPVIVGNGFNYFLYVLLVHCFSSGAPLYADVHFLQL